MSEGVVETINPAVETFFELLGNDNGRPENSKLLLTISLRRGLVPGFHINPDEEYPHGTWFTMDLPNTIAKLRTIYTLDTVGVEVVWKG